MCLSLSPPTAGRFEFVLVFELELVLELELELVFVFEFVLVFVFLKRHLVIVLRIVVHITSKNIVSTR